MYKERSCPKHQICQIDEGMIEEAYNDVMLTVWRKAHQFRAGSKVSSWIFSIAYRVCLRMVRKQKFRSGVLEMFGQTQKEPPKGEEAHREDESLITQALERLSAQHRSIIELAYYCGHSTQEIAEIAGCPVNTVKTRLFHARKKIREFVERNGGLGECP